MKPTIRTLILGAALLFGVIFSAPTLLGTSGSKITLGLDLQGGLHMLLGVKSEEALASRIASLASSFTFFSNREDVLVETLHYDEETLHIKLLDADDALKVQTYFALIEGLEVVALRDTFTVTLTQEEQLRIKQQAIDQVVETIRNRLDQFGLAEPTVAKQGEDKILVELPGIKTQEEEQRARELIAKSAHLELLAVDEARSMQAYTLTDAQAKSYGSMILDDLKGGQKYVVKIVPILDGSKLTNAQVGFDQNNQPVINFELDSQGAQIFGDFTERNVGNRLAVVLDGVVYSAPNIRERIGGGHGQISGSFTISEANDLAIALRSGALQAPVYLMEKRSIGPSLGADSIQAALVALVGGFVLVVFFMMLYYNMAGVIANVALIANLLIIIGVMAMLGATLTLPGMAGIVLTVGMAVDANVIIGERIRELLIEGKSAKKAIEEGYANAMRAIMDANITTLIAAVVLYVYGTGPIKGFAITISIGILASMITAIVGTHGIYDLFVDKLSNKTKAHTWFGLKGA